MKRQFQRYSNFSILGVCLSNCGGSAGDEQAYADELNAAIDKCEQDNSTQADTDACIAQQKINLKNKYSSNSGGGSGGSINNPIAEANKWYCRIFPNGVGCKPATTNTNTNPAPTSNKLILGMDPLLGVGVILAGAALVTWGIVAAVKASNKTAKAA